MLICLVNGWLLIRDPSICFGHRQRSKDFIEAKKAFSESLDVLVCAELD